MNYRALLTLEVYYRDHRVVRPDLPPPPQR